MTYIYLTLIVIYIVDLSGFSDTVCEFASKLSNRRVTEIKPLTCSLCMTWWANLLLALIRHDFTFETIAFIALLSFLSFPISRFLILIYDGIVKLIDALSRWTN